MLTNKSILFSLVALLCLLTTARSEARESDFERGLRYLQSAEDQQALEAFQRALRSTKVPAERARSHMYLGITHYNLLQQEQAKDQFRTAFSIEPELTLPDDTSPVIVAFVGEIKAELAADRADASTPSPPPPPPPPKTPPVGELNDFVPDHARQNKPSVARKYWPAWLAIGVGLAAGGAGIGLGALASSREEDSADKSLPYSEAQTKYEEAADLALGANVLFGVAGAAALTAGIFFYLGHGDDEDDEPLGASVLPLPGGALLQLKGVSW